MTKRSATKRPLSGGKKKAKELPKQEPGLLHGLMAVTLLQKEADTAKEPLSPVPLTAQFVGYKRLTPEQETALYATANKPMTDSAITITTSDSPMRHSVPRTGALLTEAVAYLSDMFEQAGLPNEFAQVYDAIADTTSALEKLKEMTKARLLSAVTSEGTQVTEKGTQRLVANNWQIEARPHRTGLDDKKVEALLRAKGYTDLSRGMEQVITYKASSDKLATLVSAGILTQDELDTCNVDFTWALQKPKRVVENNNDGNDGEYT